MLNIKRKISTSPAHITVQSIDEQIARVFQSIIEEASSIPDKATRDQWMDAVQTFQQTGNIKALEPATRYRRAVVPLDEFLFGKGFLGQREKDIFPGVQKFLHDIDNDQYDEIIEKGALGIGKTTGANLGVSRDLYKLSCMRNPQDTYGIARGTPMVFTIQSIRLSTARKVVFEELGRYIRNSPYFQRYFPFNRLITSEMIFPEFNIHIQPISSSGTGVISMNVIGGQLDEMNFMMKNIKSKSSQADAQGNFDQAMSLYDTLASRRKSRFVERDDLPGALYLISSSRFPEDFTEKKAAQSTMRGGDDERIYVFEGSNWEVKGRDKFDKEEFRVQIGNATFPSKVLVEGQNPALGCNVISVPMNFHKDFMRDVDGSIRDHAGLTTLSTHPFFTQRDKISEAMTLGKEHGYENPLSMEEYNFSLGLPTLNIEKLRNDVKAPRHCHIDLGVSKDACGFAVGHIAGHKIKEFKNETTGKMQTEVLPVIAYDIICRIIPPAGGEIEFEQIRSFLRLLRGRYKLPIETVTFDGFQSVDSKQILNKQGFRTGYMSVEKPEPWRTFRDAIYDGRVLLTNNNWLSKELAEVETKTTNTNKEKIDHRPHGTKDVADAVIGVAAFLMQRRLPWAQIEFKQGRTGLFLLGDDAKKLRLGSNKPTVPLSELPYDPKTRPGVHRRPTIRRSSIRK